MQPPTKEEKQAYWHNVKKVLVIGLSIIVIIGIIFKMYYNRQVITPHIVPFLTTFQVVLMLSLTYYETLKNRHMMCNRHRHGYYATYMNDVFLSIVISIAVLVFIVNYPSTWIWAIIGGICTLLLTWSSYHDLKKNKPILSPVSEIENEHRKLIIDVLIGYIIVYRIDGKISKKIDLSKYGAIISKYTVLTSISELYYYLNYGPYSIDECEQLLKKYQYLRVKQVPGENSYIESWGSFVDEIQKLNQTYATNQDKEQQYKSILHKTYSEIDSILTRSNQMDLSTEAIHKKIKKYFD